MPSASDLSRIQPIDLDTSRGTQGSTPDRCQWNLTDTGALVPDYPREVHMELSVTSVQIANVLTAVQPFNQRFWVTGGGQTVTCYLPIQNFSSLRDLAAAVQAQLAPLVAIKVNAIDNTNKLQFVAPATMQGTYTIFFQDPSGASGGNACKLMGFRATDKLALALGQAAYSTVPCAVSGPSTLYLISDLFSPDGQTIELFNSSQRGTVLAKLSLTDAPWTISSYQDQLQTFALSIPAFQISELTILLLNEELQPAGMPLDYSLTMQCRYYKNSPLVAIQQQLDHIDRTLTNIWLDNKHAHADIKKQMRLARRARAEFEYRQGHSLDD